MTPAPTLARHCGPCQVDWYGDTPCWVCDQPGLPGYTARWAAVASWRANVNDPLPATENAA